MCQSMLQGVVGGERKKHGEGEGAGKEVERDGQEEEHSVEEEESKGQEAGDEDRSSAQTVPVSGEACRPELHLAPSGQLAGSTLAKD